MATTSFCYVQRPRGQALDANSCHVCHGQQPLTCPWEGHQISHSSAPYYVSLRVSPIVQTLINRLHVPLRKLNHQLLSDLPSLAQPESTSEDHQFYIDNWFAELDHTLKDTPQQPRLQQLYFLQNTLEEQARNMALRDESNQSFMLNLLTATLNSLIDKELQALQSQVSQSSTPTKCCFIHRTCSWIKDTVCWLGSSLKAACIPAKKTVSPPSIQPPTWPEQMRDMMKTCGLDDKTITRLANGANIFNYGQADILLVALAWKNIRSSRPDSRRNLDNFLALLNFGGNQREKLTMMAHKPYSEAIKYAYTYIDEIREQRQN